MTGAIALVIILWTAIGAVTFARHVVRNLFGLPFDTRSYWLLKARDFLAASVFGGAMLFGAVLSWAGVWVLGQVYHLLGWSTGSWLFNVSVRTVSIIVTFVLDAVALAVLVCFLAVATLSWRYIWPGVLLSGGMVVLQLAAGLLISRVPSNPLVASFAVIVGLLLWCRWLAIIMLMATSWIAVTAMDHDQPLEQEDEVDARKAEEQALILDTRVQLRGAEKDTQDAPWHRRTSARHAVRRAQEALADAESGAESGNVRGHP